MNLNSILIGSEDPQRLWDYYTNLFGKPWEDGDYKGWKVGSGFISVGAHSEVKGKNAHPGRILLNMESSDVRGDFEKLKSAGAIVVQEPYEPAEGYWVATLSDPDDNYFQLVSPM